MTTLRQRIGNLIAGKTVDAKFDVAQTTGSNRKHWANADSLAARAAVSPVVRHVVRIRSRYEADNNPWYAGILRTAVNHIVGKGPRLQVMTGDRALDLRIETAWRRWAAKAKFNRMLRSAVETYWKDGEVFVRRIHHEHGNTLNLGVLLIEADQIASPLTSAADPLTDDGIRLDANTHALSYHVLHDHPGAANVTHSQSGEWVDANHIVHLFRASRPGQTRGIPRATSGLQMLPIMRRQELATLYSAETAANFAMVLKTNSPTIQAAVNNGDAFEEVELAANMLTSLPAGWEVDTVGSNLPGPDYESFQRQTLQAFSRCTNMPQALAAGSARDSNFSSYKGDVKNVWQPEVEVEQCEIETTIADPVFEWFMEAAVFEPGLLDRAPPTAEIDHRWVWPPLPQLDAITAAKASALRLSTGQAMPSSEANSAGSDFETELQRGAEDYGVSVDELRSAIFRKTFDLQAEMAPRTATTEQTDLDKRPASAEAAAGRMVQAADAPADVVEMTADFTVQAGAKTGQRRFEILAYSGGYLPVAAYPVPVIIDLRGLEASAGVPILIDHQKSVEATLGLTDEIANSGRDLRLRGLVTATSDLAKQVLKQDAVGHTWQASIGVQVLEAEELKAGQSITVNGQTLKGPAIVGRRSVLRETSVLPMGADRSTSVNLAAAAAHLIEGTAEMTFEEWLAELGLKLDDLSAERQAALELAYGAEYPDEADKAAPVAAEAKTAPVPVAASAAVTAAAPLDVAASLRELNRQAALQFTRHADIGRIARNHPKIAAKAIEAGWSNDKVELEVMKADSSKTRPTSFGTAQNKPENEPQILEAALCMTRGIKDVDKQYPDQVLQAAHDRFKRGIGLQQLLITAAAANGMPSHIGMVVNDSNMAEVCRFARGQGVQASFSAISLPGILSNVANKEALEAYMEEDDTWRRLAAIKTVSDFKQTTSYRMLADAKYEKVGPGGKIKHGTLGEESYTRQADTYARMFGITRQDIINDDMQMFDDIRAILGVGAATSIRELFWATFLDNSTFYTADRTNYISGSTTNLGADGVGLGLGVKAWRTRTTPAADGAKRVGGAAPNYLLVPPELETIADQLYVAHNSNAVKASEVNTHHNKYEPIVVPELSDAAYTGYSATAWYLGRYGALNAPVAVSFLNGQQTPTIEAADSSFDTLGFEFRGFHDVGCNKAEYLGTIKSKGAA